MTGAGLRKQAGSLGTRIARITIVRFILALAREISDDDVFGTAAEMAYRFLFAIFPLMLFLVSALGFVGTALGFDHLFQRLMTQAEPFLPSQVSQILDEYVGGLLAVHSKAFLTAGLLGTLWGAAGGVGALVKGLNRAYDIDNPRPFWKRQSLALATTLILPTVALVLFALSVLGRSIAVWLGIWLGLGHTPIQVMAAARWPILVVFLFLSMTLLYHIFPNVRHRYIWSLPGGALATIGWLVLTQVFGFYVSNFGKYDATYGSFGAAMAFLLWLYFINVVILLGAEINALLEPTERKLW